ncbi:plastid division protein PDV2-like [Selaginella moellendorffii]|uniref:plastid division protein PDV2-like n=1 Tax=Selaginella moellendorffii TaxID=88036 RepID=UPI000D1CB120|nr:plastid division protein PDV2-like [Selaginella moellendorffii]|eukprot:XP_024540262.1 plastid division protein PDV2-like [Selaginella moellendorffii]
MEPDEISVVLQRASDLHTRINDAIERALKSEFLLTAGKARDSVSSAARDRGEEEEEQGSNVGLLGEPNAEAKSLGAIRDALEALEEQLECLQALQQQQRMDRDTALAELEESRLILLSRLRSHHGKEWEIIHEALAFAGEPVGIEQEKSPARITQAGEPIRIEEQHGDRREIHKKFVANFLGIPIKLGLDLRRFAGRLFGPGVGVTSRAAMVMAGVLTTIILFSEIGSRHERRSSSEATTAPPVIPTPSLAIPPRAPAMEERCPPGKVMIFVDGVSKCVVKERIEIPFRGEVSSPDVLYGRG